MENVPTDSVLAEKITLAKLYNTKLDISILFPTRSTWVIGLAQIEDEIEYYDSFNWPEIEKPLKVLSSIAKRQKVEIIIDSD